VKKPLGRAELLFGKKRAASAAAFGNTNGCQTSKGRSYQMKGFAVKLWRDEEGQDLTEYALLLVLVSLAAVAAMKSLATQVGAVFTNAANNLNTGS
jgi:pilus assembly protein Flp/PilA